MEQKWTSAPIMGQPRLKSQGNMQADSEKCLDLSSHRMAAWDHHAHIDRHSI